MCEKQDSDSLKTEDSQVVKQLNANTTAEGHASLLNMALNNRLGLDAAALGQLTWQGLDRLYTILGEALDASRTRIEKDRPKLAEWLKEQREQLPESVEMPTEAEDQWAGREESERFTLQALLLLGQIHGALHPAPPGSKLGR